MPVPSEETLEAEQGFDYSYTTDYSYGLTDTIVLVSESGFVASSATPSAIETSLASESVSVISVSSIDVIEVGNAIESGTVLSVASPSASEISIWYESGSVSAQSSISATELGTAAEQSLVESAVSFAATGSASAYERASMQASGLFATADTATATESSAMTASSFVVAAETSAANEFTLVETDSTVDVLEVVSYSVETTSHVDPITSFATSDRTSLELIDFDVTYDSSTASWYTDWFSEDKILGDEDVMAVIGYVVEGAKEPAATIQVEYDATGDGDVDARSTEVRVDRAERPTEIEGVPIDEDGYYRLIISEYSGYNSLTTLNAGFVH